MRQGGTLAIVATVLGLAIPAEAAAVDRWFEVRVRSVGAYEIEYSGGRLSGSYAVSWDWQTIGVVRYRGDDFEPEVAITRYYAREQSDVRDGGRLVGCRGRTRAIETRSTPENRRRAKGKRGDHVRAGQLALDDGQMFVSPELGPPRRNCDHRHVGAHDLEGVTGYGEEFESPITITRDEFDPAGTSAFSGLFRRELSKTDPHELEGGEEPHTHSGTSAARVSIKPLSARVGKRRLRSRERVPEPR